MAHVGKGEINWQEIAEKLPYQKTSEAKKARIAMFKGMDPNGNGILSLAEVDKGMRDIISLPQMFDFKPVMLRAFNAAKAIHASKGKQSKNDDYVEFMEFRLLLAYLRQYFELYVMFQRIDISGDGRIEKAEFNKAADLIKTWGVDMKDPDKTFAYIDKNGGGIILFDEFADWAIKKHLDLEDDDDAADPDLPQ